MRGVQPLGPRWPVEQFAAAIRALLVENIGAFGAKGALKAADEGTGCLGGQIATAFLAIRAHVEHGFGSAQAAASATAAQMASTTA